jgi:adenosylmethionine-8-amino-7-oxononanoate aminotransferase
MPNSSSVFPRSFKKDLPVASHGEGCWLIDQSGQRYLDASGQAAVVSIGHGVAEIGRAMAEQASQIAFAHTTQFHSASAERLAGRIRGDRDGDQAGATIPSRDESSFAISCGIAAAELSREHVGRDGR